jgi:uncharacterized LabA/DUF88 family protein
LCLEALPAVAERARDRGMWFEIVDVDESGMAQQFGDRVPVVLLDDTEVLSGRFSERDVKRAIR